MGKQSDKKSKKWKIAAGIILVIQALISIVSVGIVVWFNLLPLKYLVLIGLILIWLLTLVYYFFYSGVRKKKGKKLTAQKKKRKLYQAKYWWSYFCDYDGFMYCGIFYGMAGW